MVREKLEKLETKQLRKYITEHNKVVRKYIGEEIKQARVEYNQQLKVKRREMRAAQTLDAKGKKKPELIDLIMSEPLLVKRLKSELRVPFENLEKKKETVRQIKKQKDKQSKQKKESVSFKSNLIDIEKRKSDPRIQEIIYDDEESNIYIELTLTGKKDLLIEFQYSQFNKDKPRAPKGSTRKILCNLINNLIEKNVVSKTATVSLITGDIGGTQGQKHDVTKLKKMYEEMGFKAQRDKDSKDQMYEMSIKKFFEWCQKTYTDEFFILAEKKKPKVIKIKKKPKVPEITITEAEEPTGGAAAEPKSKLGPIPKSNVRIRVAPKKKPEPDTDVAEQSDEEAEEKYDRKKVKVIKEIKKNKAGWLDYLESLLEGDDEPTMESVSQNIQERYYKALITRESNFVKRVKKNEKGKGSAKEQKQRTVKNNNILNIVREEIRNKPNIRKLFIDLNPEIMKRFERKAKEDKEKEDKATKEKQTEEDKFILGNIKFFEDELKEVKKRQQNPSTKAMIEELEERIAEEKSKLSKNK